MWVSYCSRVWVVLEALGHLLAVLGQHEAVTDQVLEGGPAGRVRGGVKVKGRVRIGVRFRVRVRVKVRVRVRVAWRLDAPHALVESEVSLALHALHGDIAVRHRRDAVPAVRVRVRVRVG